MLCFFLAGCAGNYSALELKSLDYTKGQGASPKYQTEYRYDVLTKHSNKKYAKKEDRTNIRLVAVKFTNNSDAPVNGNELRVFSGDQEITLVDKETVYKKLKQGSAIYLLYLPLIMTKTECGRGPYGGCETKMLFPIGVPISLLNILVSATSNANFKKDLSIYDFKNKTIKPGQSEYVVIAVRNANYGVINVFPTLDVE